MKLAKILWSLGSLLVNATIIVYIFLSSKAPEGIAERYAYINENWGVYEAHWKVEFVLMAFVAIGALYFAIVTKRVSWAVITIGQVMLLFTYPIMLGGYHDTPIELAEMANEMATIVFVTGNLVFLGGLLLLYLNDRVLNTVVRYLAVVLSGSAGMAFFLTFTGVIEWEQALKIGPLINLLYLINAYHGLKIQPDTSN